MTGDNGGDWSDVEKSLVSQLQCYVELLADFTQAESLQALGRGEKVKPLHVEVFSKLLWPTSGILSFLSYHGYCFPLIKQLPVGKTSAVHCIRVIHVHVPVNEMLTCC